MSRLDQLAPDQSAVLSLLLRRRKSYSDVASLLGIAERAVQDRAHAALAMLAPREAAALDADSRAEIGDYLLSQQSAARATATRAQLQDSAAARSWARILSAELAPLSTERLPEIPTGDQRRPAPAPVPSRSAATVSNRTPDAESAHTTRRGDASMDSSEPPSSRRAGALLLAAIAVVIVVAVVLITSGGGKDKSKSAAHASTGTSSTSSTSSTAAAKQPHVDKRFTLKPLDSTSKALGAAELLSQGNKRAFFLIAQALPATQGFFYVAWLYNSQNSFKALGRGPAVTSTGALRAVGALPTNTGQYHRLILTRETSTKATHPGPIVLSGSYS